MHRSGQDAVRKGISMWYIAVFSVVAVVLVVAVVVQRSHSKAADVAAKSPVHSGTAGASRTHSGSAERRERKRRRSQSRTDRRKRH